MGAAFADESGDWTRRRNIFLPSQNSSDPRHLPDNRNCIDQHLNQERVTRAQAQTFLDGRRALACLRVISVQSRNRWTSRDTRWTNRDTVARQMHEQGHSSASSIDEQYTRWTSRDTRQRAELTPHPRLGRCGARGSSAARQQPSVRCTPRRRAAL